MKKLTLLLISLILINSLFASENEEEKQDHYLSSGLGYGYYVTSPIYDSSNDSIMIHGPAITLKGEDTINKSKGISAFSFGSVVIPLKFIINNSDISNIDLSFITDLTTGVLQEHKISDRTTSYVGAGVHMNCILLITDTFAIYNIEGGIGSIMGMKSEIGKNSFFDIGLNSAVDFFEWANTKTALGETSGFTSKFFGAGMKIYALYTYKL